MTCDREVELHRLNRTLKAIGRLNRAVMQAKDEPDFLQHACRILVEDCGYKMVWIGYAEADPAKTVRPVAHHGFDQGYLDKLAITWADTERGRGPTGTAIRTGRPAICRNMLTDPAFAPWRAEAIKRGYASSVVLPLLEGGAAFGGISIYSTRPDDFSDQELDLLAELASNLVDGVAAFRMRAARAQAEAALRHKQAELTEAQRIAHVGSWHWDARTHVTTGSDELLRIFGIDPATGQLPDFGAQGGSCYPLEDWRRLNAAVQETLRTGVGYQLDLRALRTGTPIWITARGEVVRDAAGQVVGLCGTVQDITERKQQEEAIAHAKQQWELTFDSVPDLIAILDERHRIVRVNRAMAERLGVASGGCVGRACCEVVHGTAAPPDYCPHTRTLLDRREHLVEAYEQRLGGEFLISTTPMFGRDGAPVGSVHVARDVTTLKQAEQAQQRLIAKLQTVNRDLNEFAHAVSHDLKAPLRAVAGLADLIALDYRDRLDAEGRSRIDLIKGRIKRMYELIDGVLEYSRLGRVEGTRVCTDLAGVVERAIDFVAPPPAIKVTVESALPAIVCDPLRLHQVFQNLIGNAVKHMDRPQGEVWVGCCASDDGWRFHVRDNGPGIDPRHHARIFEIFQTLKPKDEFASTGIGLAIVRRIVEAHGGRVWVESTVGAGSTFYFTVPQEATAASP